MTTAHQLYPAARLAGMSDVDLEQVMCFALADCAETSSTVYDGMTRGETVRTAQRTIDDVAAEQGQRAAERFTGESHPDYHRVDALPKLTEHERSA